MAVKKNEIKENDPEGLKILESIAVADKFNLWMYQTIEPFCNGNILEIGSGIGNISQYFIRNDRNIHLSDLRENYCSLLKTKFEHYTNVLDISIIDLVAEDFEIKYDHLLSTFNTVFALNVIEHIKEDRIAVENCIKLLKPGGHLIILVPAYNSLYNNFDKALEHFRRYNKTKLNQVFSGAKLKIIHSQYFNAFGILGWWVMGSLLKKKSIPKEQMKLYNFLMPLIRFADFAVFNKIGLSVIAIGEKEINELG